MIRYFALLLPLLGFSVEKLVYESTTSGHTIKTNWEIEEKGGKIHATSDDPNEKITLEYSEKYELISFAQTKKKENTIFTASISGSHLKAAIEGGKSPIKNSYNVKYPWVQEFTLGLKPFIASNHKSMKFVILNPKDATVNNMIAIKQKNETIHVSGKKYDALKVKITLQGFQSLFWSAYSWWDVKENRQLRYQGNDGPHTPTTTVDFVSEEGKMSSTK